MTQHRALFLTGRSERHQKSALAAAPAEIEVIMRANAGRAEILALLPEVEFLISERTGAIDAEMIAAGRGLRLIQRLGSQTYDIDLPAARQAGIPVCFWPVQTCTMVAEHAIMLMLALARHLPDLIRVTNDADDWGQEPQPCDENRFAYNWSKRAGIRGLAGATVGILGMGEIGGELARRLAGMGCTVLYNKRTPLPPHAEEEIGARWTGLAELQARSDFLCVLLPHSPETAGMINRAFIDGMKPGAFLINTGTSTAMNEPEVAQALLDGCLGGLGSDGFVWEPIRADNPLLPLARDPSRNVILTPHVAAGDLSASREVRVKDFGNLLRVLRGEPLINRLV